MITFTIDEYGNDNKYQGLNCFLCGTEIVPHRDDGGQELGNCKHLIYHCTNETWESPESMTEDVFKNFDENDPDADRYEFLDKNLSDEYLMIICAGSSLSGLDGIAIFKQNSV